MIRIDGAKIRRLRESKKLTQLYLSTVVGVTTDTISRWENKHYQSIKLENAQKLAEALEVNFEEILKQEEPAKPESSQQEDTPSQEKKLPPAPSKNKLTGVLTAIFLVCIAAFVLYQRYAAAPHSTISASRVLPPHVAPGQVFPVLIRIDSPQNVPVSLIIKELIPKGTMSTRGLPQITSIDRKQNSLKWIQRLDTDQAVYAYLCRVPVNFTKERSLVFEGTVTLKQNVKDRQTIEGNSSLHIAPYHWADSNRDYMIDDEEILAVYDTYSDIEELQFNRELIDSIWASSGYAWDSGKEHFVTKD